MVLPPVTTDPAGSRRDGTSSGPTRRSMKAVRSMEGGVAVVELDEPPGIGELLDMRATSICGSDLSYIRFGSRAILGHELSGVRADGTAVVVEAIYGCMECPQCERGAYNLCPTHGQRALGISADGGMAEQFRAPTARLVTLPKGLDVRDASLVEPAAVSWHALRLAGTGLGTRVAVVGAGALGLLAVAGAHRLGADAGGGGGAPPLPEGGRRAPRRACRR
jgi:threonine dehydrogenase-like Zn-dependent dehydrogenase